MWEVEMRPVSPETIAVLAATALIVARLWRQVLAVVLLLMAIALLLGIFSIGAYVEHYT
jgi:hypothetical protein